MLRVLLISGLAVSAALSAPQERAHADEAPLALPASGEVSFDVFRREGYLGTHTLTFRNEGEEFSATVDVELKVRIGPITFFYYKHDAEEVWRNGEFASLSAETRKDRKDLFVEAQAEDGGVLVRSTAQEGLLDPSLLPTTWWNEQSLQRAALLNAELGEVLQLEILETEETTYEVAGQVVDATRYRVGGTLELDLFYDDAGRWIGCEFIARGAIVRYIMTTPYTPV